MHDERSHPLDALVLDVYDELSAEARRALHSHLSDCDSCREARRTLASARDLVAVPRAPRLDEARVEELVRRATQARPAPCTRRTWLVIGGAVAATLIAAIYLVPSRSEKHGDSSDARAINSLTLLEQPASQQRLRGIMEGRPVLTADRRVSAAFVRTLRTDPSPNVRLAAIDAFESAPSASAFDMEISAALADERSPAVRRALIDLLEALGSPPARRALEQVQRADPDASLRARASAALTRLARGDADAHP